MTMKLKNGFFRVNPYNPYVPLTEDFYAVENDNSFQIYKGNNVIASYSGFSRGIGKVLSTFNVEYCVYENGASLIRCVDNNNRNTLLTSVDNTVRSMFCAGDKVYVVRVSDGRLVVSQYIIVGSSNAPVLDKLKEHSIILSGEARGEIFAAIKISDSSVYCYRYLTGTASGGDLHTHWVKVSISGNDFSIQTLTDEYPEISALHTLAANNTGFEFYNPLPVSANITVGYNSKEGAWLAHIIVYKDQNQIADYKIPISGYNSVPGAAKVFFDTDGSGNGYALVGSMNGTPVMVMSVYRIQNGSYSLLTSKTSGKISAVRPAGVLGQVSGYYPWYGRFCGFPYGTNSYISYKANATLSDITLSTAALTTSASNPNILFGNTIKWM